MTISCQCPFQKGWYWSEIVPLISIFLYEVIYSNPGGLGRKKLPNKLKFTAIKRKGEK